MRLIYSVKKVLEILGKDLEFEDAMEYFDYNIRDAYVGEQTPLFCDDYF